MLCFYTSIHLSSKVILCQYLTLAIGQSAYFIQKLTRLRQTLYTQFLCTACELETRPKALY